MKVKHFLLTAGVAMLLAPAAASAYNPQDKAIDMHGRAIMDARGNCVNTKWVVDHDVCEGEYDELNLSRAERTVYFGFNKSTLQASEKAKLDSLISAIQGSKGVTSVDIVGHADMIGTSDYNMGLSKRRAAVVSAYLQKYGNIKTRNLDVRAVGEAGSVTNCDSSLSRDQLIGCLAQDRRVEIRLNYAE